MPRCPTTKIVKKEGTCLVYRADHVGSLLRPKELRDKPDDVDVQNKCILDILGRQRDLGFKIFTDGEFRRRGFMSDLYESIEGLNNEGAIARTWQGGAAKVRLY